MRVWFDILTPKQVMFFRRAVERLRQSGHEVLCTSRQYREAVELARIKNLGLTIAGSHGGADRYDKLRMSANRTYELAEIVDRFNPAIAVSFSSPEGARVAYGLRLKNIVFNDSPHSEAVARLTIPLASKLYCPWVIPASAWVGFGISRKSIVRYHALDPAAWLKHEKPLVASQVVKGRVLVRLEESKASYMTDGARQVQQFLDRFVEQFHGSTKILVLCRYQDQIEEISARHGSRVEVLKEVVYGTELLRSVELFIGAGGTMTAEAALLGKPTISITPFSYHVEKYLIRAGLVRKAHSVRTLLRLTERMLSDKSYAQDQRKKAERILAAMEDPSDRIVKAVSALRL